MIYIGQLIKLTIIKYQITMQGGFYLKSFDYFYKKYYGKLNYSCVPQVLLSSFSSWSKQSLQALIDNKVSKFLVQTHFSRPFEIPITSNQEEQKQLFQYFFLEDDEDQDGISAHEFYYSMMFFVYGEDCFDQFLKSFVKLMGEHQKQEVHKYAFMFGVDFIFRSISQSILDDKDKNRPTQQNLKIHPEDILGITKNIFGTMEFMTRSKVIQAIKKQEKLSEFLKYICRSFKPSKLQESEKLQSMKQQS